MKEKYIKLLLERCINFDKSKSLFINYNVINQDFVDEIVVYAKNIGIDDIYLDKYDLEEKRDILNSIKLEDIDNHPYFDSSIWDEYAKKDASFLILESEIPGILDDVDSKKVARCNYIERKTKPLYKKKQLEYVIPWCIAAVPNKYWAKEIFKNDNSLDKFWKVLGKICMLDTDNPIMSWNNQIHIKKTMCDKLNNLKIKLLHYKNSLGTDLTLELPNDSCWCAASGNGIVNMPSYEVFTSPNFKKTNGIVYSSRPLSYNGALIDQFWIKFKDGKAIDCKAKIGEEILKGIINSDSNSCYLGECALVNNDSPISNTGLVFGTTLIDENASCHLALGAGFKKSLINGKDLTDKELLEKGINVTPVHVDFMIGTPDLEIEAETINKEKVKIFENGNFKINKK